MTRGNLSTRRPFALATGGAVLSVLLLGGCVTSAAQGRRMQAQLDGLEVGTRELREELAEQRRQLEEISRRLGEIESGTSAARRTGADLGATMDRQMTEIQRLQGAIEELRFRLERAEQANQASLEDAERRKAAGQGEAALRAFEARRKAEQLERPTEPAAFLDLARQRLQAGETGVARPLLEEFLQKWPDDRGAAEARYLLGETYYREKQWRPAIHEFNRFRERYPKDRRMPGALLRIGESFAAIGLKPEAGSFFDALIKAHPDSPEARQARIRKKELDLR